MATHIREDPSLDIKTATSPQWDWSEAHLSILFRNKEKYSSPADSTPPDCFEDLRLNEIVDVITSAEDESIRPYFYKPLSTAEEIGYRYDSLREVEDPEVSVHVRRFTEGMQTVQEYRSKASGAYDRHETQGLLFNAVELYGDVVIQFEKNLSTIRLRSEGFVKVHRFLQAYIESEEFTALHSETRQLRDELDKVRYCLHIAGDRISATRCRDEQDFTIEITECFRRFNKDPQKKYQFSETPSRFMDHVEGAVLELVARLFPDTFASLERYCERNARTLEPNVLALAHEIQFCLACVRHMEKLRAAGLKCCYPRVSERPETISGKHVFDLALANVLLREKQTIVTNDFHLDNDERILVISGPNQGGKTSFARMLGQLHYLAKIGVPVPGEQVRLFLCDKILTVFERNEDVRSLRGKLEDELIRTRTALECATRNSLLILNEAFTSTAPSDALFVSRRILEHAAARDVLCVVVTFLDELASFDRSTVSMVSSVDRNDPERRTFRILRQCANGRAYAMTVAEKYKLRSSALKNRIAQSSVDCR